ncbi:MAG: protease inhibitor I42 family protein [Methanomicrobia archaeon]|nr:protease inhibitor I42 family protein [Methanomicrobia archaeon]
METKRYIIAGILIVILLLIVIWVAYAPGGARLTEMDNGKTLTVAVGQELDVMLKANPTTGYTWVIVEPTDERIIRQMGELEFEPESDALGAGGVQIIRFEVVGAGQTTLKLMYHRPWESVEPLQTFSVTLIAQ